MLEDLHDLSDEALEAGIHWVVASVRGADRKG